MTKNWKCKDGTSIGVMFFWTRQIGRFRVPIPRLWVYWFDGDDPEENP